MNSNWPNITGYEVQAEIGRGGMGVVYRVRQRASDRVLALKMLLGNRGASFVELARFRVEIEALACLNHPNIVKIRDVGLYAGAPFFALDYAERGSLKQAIASGLQTPRMAAELVRVLALAMQHAHDRGMLHRDLKPANVLLMQDGTPVVSDFGLVKFANPLREVSELHCTMSTPAAFDVLLANLARELGAPYDPATHAPGVCTDDITRSIWEQCAARTGVLGDGTRLQSVRQFLTRAKEQAQQPTPDLDELTQAGAVMGSPSYMAPEQAAGNHAQIGPRTDVYALGGILYELLTGQPPFRSSSLFDLLSQACSTRPAPPRQLAPDVSADIEAVCLKCLEKSPDSRYQSATALAEDLSRFLDGYSPRAVAMAGSSRPMAGSSRPVAIVAVGDVPFTHTQVAQTPCDVPAPTRTWWPFGRSKAGGGRLPQER